jgi:hypothetical protein
MIRVLSATAGALGLTPQEEAAAATKRVWANTLLMGGGLLALGWLWYTSPKRKKR